MTREPVPVPIISDDERCGTCYRAVWACTCGVWTAPEKAPRVAQLRSHALRRAVIEAVRAHRPIGIAFDLEALRAEARAIVAERCGAPDEPERAASETCARFQTKDIETDAVLLAVAAAARSGLAGAMLSEVVTTLRRPRKVVLAKLKALIGQGLLDGCACGCRGDFQITAHGESVLAELRATEQTAASEPDPATHAHARGTPEGSEGPA